MESNSRSIAKAVTYRVLGSASTAIIVFFVSHNVSWSLGAGLVDGVVKVAMYFIHERIWNHIDFGRPKPPEYEI
jgi:adenylylsulfate kinase